MVGVINLPSHPYHQYSDLATGQDRRLMMAFSVQTHKYGQIRAESRLLCAPSHRHLTLQYCMWAEFQSTQGLGFLWVINAVSSQTKIIDSCQHVTGLNGLDSELIRPCTQKIIIMIVINHKY